MIDPEIHFIPVCKYILFMKSQKCAQQPLWREVLTAEPFSPDRATSQTGISLAFIICWLTSRP